MHAIFKLKFKVRVISTTGIVSTNLNLNTFIRGIIFMLYIFYSASLTIGFSIYYSARVSCDEGLMDGFY